MALSFDETVSLVVYSALTLTIVTIMVLVKFGRLSYTAGGGADMKQGNHKPKTVCQQEEAELAQLVTLHPEIDLIEFPGTDKQRNRHRSHREWRSDGRRDTVPPRPAFFSSPSPPLVTEYHSPPSTVRGHGGNSFQSVYLSDEGAQDTDCEGDLKSLTEEKQNSPVGGGIACPDHNQAQLPQSPGKVQVWHDQSRIDKTEQKNQVCTNRSADADLPLPCTENQVRASVEKTVKTSKGKSACHKSTLRTHEFPTECKVVKKEHKVKLEASKSARSASDKEEEEEEETEFDRFHVARPALPTTMGPSGVCVDSFGQLDICPPPQDGRPVCCLKQDGAPPQFEPCGSSGGSVNRPSLGRAYNIAADREAVRGVSDVLMNSASSITAHIDREPSPQETRRSPSRSPQPSQRNGQESSQEHDDSGRHGGQWLEGSHDSWQIERAAREVINSRLLHVSSSPSPSVVTTNGKGRSAPRESGSRQPTDTDCSVGERATASPPPTSGPRASP